MPRKRNRMGSLAAILFVAALTGLHALSPGSMSRVAAQTVPTITPTPGDDPTTAPGPTSQPQPTEAATTPAEQPTPTRRPAGQATATRPTTTRRATGSATPTAILSGTEAAYPTAEACSLEPTVRVLDGGAWLYDGPGEDYDRLGRLAEDTVRPLLGRAAEARWWLVELAEGEQGWIADEDVAVQGDTSELPVEEAPELPDGDTPTPGPTWEPTARADCLTPTATPTVTATATATAGPTSTPDPTATVTSTATPTPAPAATDEVEPLPVEEDETSSLRWLPVLGLFLLAVGAFIFVSRRN